jgi:hypothetical protein
LLNHIVQLAVLEQLGSGAEGKTKRRHCGAQTEGVLDGTGGAHLIVTEADAKPARLPATLVSPTGWPSCTALALLLPLLPEVLLAILVVLALLGRVLNRWSVGGVGHGQGIVLGASVTHQRTRHTSQRQ